MSAFGTPAFSVDISGDLDLAGKLSDKAKRILQVQQRALSTMRRRLATEARRDIQREYNLKAQRIAQGLRVRTVEDGVAVIGSSKGINAINFGATWQRMRRGKTTQGARIKYKRAGAVVEEPGTFIARGLGGTPLVFIRDTRRPPHRVTSGANAGRMKQYLLGVYGPSIAQMLKHAGRPERLAAFAQKIIEQEIQRQLGPKGSTA